MRKLVEVIKALLDDIVGIVGKVVTVNVTVIVMNVKTAPEVERQSGFHNPLFNAPANRRKEGCCTITFI